MNGRQAAKLASKRISELEYIVSLQSKDIKDYNHAILDMIAGKSPCAWCEENEECTNASHGSAGCSGWWLRYEKQIPEGGDQPDEEGEETGATDSVLGLEEQ